ncbi:hypothetical protein EZY14_009005 [Kordia sp. TARA_039_SRF]|nr:hypothetical protein EZY14_009005 [Kordia sp. TARA_039_SRF]
MDFYERILAAKALQKLSWADIGSKINMKEAAMRVAVKRKSLSELEIKELEKYFLSENKYDVDSTEEKIENQFIIVANKKIPLKEFALAAAVNVELLKKEPVFYNTLIVESLKIMERASTNDGKFVDPKKLSELTKD